MKRAYVDIPEGQVHYRTEGKGQPLLLLHSAMSSSLEFSRMIPVLSKKYWVLAMDMLGCGESDKPPRAYQITDYARSVASFLDAMKIKKANVAGHHTGALIGVELAVTYPKLVNKLVLSGAISSPLVEDPKDLTGAPPGLAFMSFAEAFRPLEITSDGLFLQQVWGKVGNSPETPAEIKYEMCIENLQSGPRGEEAHLAFVAYNPIPRLPLIRCPTLVLSGRKDAFISHLESVQKLIPGSVSLIIEGQRSGGVTREMPLEFAEAILKFLD